MPKFARSDETKGESSPNEIQSLNSVTQGFSLDPGQP
jgi:hypothetical protein